VTVQDAGGNTVTGLTASITLAISTHPNGGTPTFTTNLNSGYSSVATIAVHPCLRRPEED
jgi:hypothetical protein